MVCSDHKLCYAVCRTSSNVETHYLNEFGSCWNDRSVAKDSSMCRHQRTVLLRFSCGRCVVPLGGAAVWCRCVVPLCGAAVWCTLCGARCVVPLCGARCWVNEIVTDDDAASVRVVTKINQIVSAYTALLVSSSSSHWGLTESFSKPAVNGPGNGSCEWPSVALLICCVVKRRDYPDHTHNLMTQQ